MDFECSTFSDFKLHVALFKLTAPGSQEMTTDIVEERKHKLIDIYRENPENLTFVNTRYVSLKENKNQYMTS